MIYAGRVCVTTGWIARRVGVHPATVWRWLQNQRGRPKLTVYEVPNAAGLVRRYVPLDELSGDTFNAMVAETAADKLAERAEKREKRVD